MLRRLRLISTVLLFLALSASAGIVRRSTSPVTLALTKQFNLTGASTILEMDRARARVLIERAKADSSRSQQAEPYNIPVVNQGVYYSTTVSSRFFSNDGTAKLMRDARLASATRRGTVGVLYDCLLSVLMLTIFWMQFRCSSIPGARTLGSGPRLPISSHQTRLSLLETSSYV